MQSDQVRELKQLQEENARLKKLVAELSLDKAILREVISKKFPGPLICPISSDHHHVDFGFG
jgi:putative transposase